MSYNLIVENNRFASIDIGTNTFRLLIAQVAFDSTRARYLIDEICSERTVTRLGDSITKEGTLRENSIGKSIEILKRYNELISRHNVSRTTAIATAALREAKNRAYFIEMAKERAGLDVEVVSGEREAVITASGILMDVDREQPALLLDIGGGSTELIFYRNNQPELIRSLDLGVLYLAGNYMVHDPPLRKDLIAMKTEITEILEKEIQLFRGYCSPDNMFIGTAGTVTALAAISQGLSFFDHDKIHKYQLSLEDAQSIYERMSVMSLADRAELLPFDPSRLDILVPGTVMLISLMELFGFKDISVSNYGLREGILIELYNEMS